MATPEKHLFDVAAGCVSTNRQGLGLIVDLCGQKQVYANAVTGKPGHKQNEGTSMIGIYVVPTQDPV